MQNIGRNRSDFVRIRRIAFDVFDQLDQGGTVGHEIRFFVGMEFVDDLVLVQIVGGHSMLVRLEVFDSQFLGSVQLSDEFCKWKWKN